ncbi:MAG: 50S ribosomal protein L29 [archaeon]
MTKKRTGPLRELGQNELMEKIVQLRSEMARERAINASGTRPENPGKIRKIRRENARILTIMGEKKKSQAAKAPEKKKKEALKAAQEKAKKTEAKKQ